MDDTDDAEMEARRRERATWPVRRYDVGDEPAEDVADLTPDERVSHVWDATRAAWAHTGQSLPDVPRSQWPGAVTRSA